jgi:methylmalonyl-CoA mutase
MDATPNLFSAFSPAGHSQWREQVAKDLKGESPGGLIWKNENGFDVKPYYTAEDLTVNYEPAFHHTRWSHGVNAPGGTDSQLNDWIRKMTAETSSVCLAIDARSRDIAKVLQGIDLPIAQWLFYSDEKSLPGLIDILKRSDLGDLNCSVFPTDINSESDVKRWLKSTLPVFSDATLARFICIDVHRYHALGALPYYELAVFMAALTEWLHFAEETGVTSPAAPCVRTAVNTDYFTSICKLRAMRRLWHLIAPEFDLDPKRIEIIVETSLANKSVTGKYNNLLRTSVEAMAAVAGGCNMLLVHELDAVSGEQTGFSRRLAVNQQRVLEHEAGLSLLADVGCGSYYIESYTDMLAEKALETFKAFEKQGGYFACLANDIFTKAIAKQSETRAAALLSGERILVGVNKYRFAGDDGDKYTDRINAAGEALPWSPVQEAELKWKRSE